MKNLSFIVPLTTILFLFSIEALANTLKPEKCPSINAVQSADVDTILKIGIYQLIALKKSNFDTQESW